MPSPFGGRAALSDLCVQPRDAISYIQFKGTDARRIRTRVENTRDNPEMKGDTMKDSTPRVFTPDLPRNDDGILESYSFPGMYPLFYITKDNGVLCPECARNAEAEGLTNDPNDPQWYIVAADINHEDASLYCDANDERIPSAYAED